VVEEGMEEEVEVEEEEDEGPKKVLMIWCEFGGRIWRRGSEEVMIRRNRRTFFPCGAEENALFDQMSSTFVRLGSCRERFWASFLSLS
jgi:hypothetical protein